MTVLTPGQLRRWVDRFGVPEVQVQRDHLISHILLHVPRMVPDGVFFGGTALCRTHLLDWRLSEDIDLLVDSATTISERIEQRVPELLRRDFPGLRVDWERSGETLLGTIAFEDVVTHVQLVRRDASYRRYPVEPTPVALRYDDLPEAVELVCPTPAAAGAMKLNAWSERKAPRDLCDLYALARANLLNEETLDIAADVAGRPVQRHDFRDDQLPPREAWVAALGHQMREPPARDVALLTVREALVEIAGGPG